MTNLGWRVLRELDLSRPKEEEILQKHGIDPKKRQGTLGGDINMWSHSIGSGQVEDLKSQYEKDYLWAVRPESAPDESTELQLTFEKGIPIALDGLKDPIDIIFRLNEVGGANGIGRIDILEDGIIGLKSRELYEAPGATILIKLHSDLEHLTLTKEQLRFKHEVVSGDVTFKLFKGKIEIVKRNSAESLFAPELRSIKRGGFDQREATGAVKIHSIPYGLYGKKRKYS